MKKGTKKADWLVGRMLIRSLLEVMTLQELADGLGVSRQAIQQAVGRGVARFRGRPRPLPHWELPSTRDKRHVSELCALGMTVREAVELLGYKWGTGHSPRRFSGHHKPSGSLRYDDTTWRGWAKRQEREVRKLVARDALLKGATIREASQVSGLPFGSIAGWQHTGALPRSRYMRGSSRSLVLRAPEPSDASSTEPKPR